MTPHLRAPDPQLSLSLLFLAAVENARQEFHKRVVAAEAEPDECCDFELMMEEPERWDGLL